MWHTCWTRLLQDPAQTEVVDFRQPGIAIQSRFANALDIEGTQHVLDIELHGLGVGCILAVLHDVLEAHKELVLMPGLQGEQMHGLRQNQWNSTKL